MSKIIHPVYKNYPEHPYISPMRDLKAWEETPEKFPYGIVEKKQMERLPEGLLPGDIVMLWRIHFNNFTNETIIPQYFEYRYGINSDQSLKDLMQKEYIVLSEVTEALFLLNVTALKRILKKHGLNDQGKKQELLDRIQANVSKTQLTQEITLRKYQMTPAGENVLNKYDDIIQKHGPKG